MNLYIALVIGKQAHQVREQIIIANKGRQRVDLAVAQIPNRHRLQRHIRIDRAGQQAPVERAQAATVGGGAFGEHQQGVLLFQMTGHLLANQLAVT